MDNHQIELAIELQSKSYLVYSSIRCVKILVNELLKDVSNLFFSFVNIKQLIRDFEVF